MKAGDIMELIILIFVLYGMVKGIKSLTRIKPKASRTAASTKAISGGSQFATLKALQEQRDSINKQIKYFSNQRETIVYQCEQIRISLKSIETVKDRERLMKEFARLQDRWNALENRQATAYGKLATVESKISKLIY